MGSFFIRMAQTFNYGPLPGRQADQSLIETVLSTVFVILGAVAVLMVVIGGIQYASSQGNPQSISRAKNTILYAVIGLVLAILARAIVAFVFERFSS